MNENDVLFQKVTQAYSEKKSKYSYQESNLRPSDLSSHESPVAQ